MCICPGATYFGKLLELLLKQAKVEVDACLLFKPDYVNWVPSAHKTYVKHIITVNRHKVPHMPCIGPRTTYFGKLLEFFFKKAKIDRCKPSFQARLRYLLSISPQYI